MQPTQKLFDIAEAMLTDAWEMRQSEARSKKEEMTKHLRKVEKDIETTVDRLIEATNRTVVSAYERRIQKLEEEKILLEEKSQNCLPAPGHFEDFIEHSLRFLATPWEIYKNGDLPLKQLVLRLAFSERLRYSRKSGYRTPKVSLPFKLLADAQEDKSHLVRVKGLEPPRQRRQNLNLVRLPIPPHPHAHKAPLCVSR